jgi:hypothetical protein
VDENGDARLGQASRQLAPARPQFRRRRRLQVVDRVRRVDDALAPVDVVDPLVAVEVSELGQVGEDLLGPAAAAPAAFDLYFKRRRIIVSGPLRFLRLAVP